MPGHGFHKRTYLLAAAVFLAAGAAGLVAGNRLSSRWAERSVQADEFRRLDEYQGLAERSGIRKDLVLDVQPATQVVDEGAPIRLSIRLTNRGERKLILNSWLSPYPAWLGSNQLPLKVDVRKSGQAVRYRGDAVLLPLHTGKDFFVLRRGESKTTVIDLLNPGNRGSWEMSAPGTYEIAVWYETYLSGKWIGVKPWTGRTNPVVVSVRVQARRGQTR